MPSSAPAPFGLKFLVICLFVCGLAFGAIAALDVAQPKAQVEQTKAAPEPTKPVEKTKPKPPEAAKPKLNDTPIPKPTEPEKAKPKPVEPEKPKPKPEPEKPMEVAKITFEKDVLPIFKAKCTKCHGDSGAKGGVDLRTLKDVLGFGVKAGDLKESKVWETIADGSMPPSGNPKVNEAEKKIISQWISSGAK
jgi:uncharacterized protein (DUF4415 family)